MTQAVAFSEIVNGLFDAYATHIITGDMDRWIESWDEEGVQMPPGAPARRGRKTILEAMKRDLQSVRYVAFAIDVEEAFTCGEFAIARGSFPYSFVRANSSERNDRIGKYLTVFRKQADGSWKIFRDCFNLDAPA